MRPGAGLYKYLCRYRSVCPHPNPAEPLSFVGMARETGAMSPAESRGFLSTQMHTLTRTRTRARARACKHSKRSICNAPWIFQAFQRLENSTSWCVPSLAQLSLEKTYSVKNKCYSTNRQPSREEHATSHGNGTADHCISFLTKTVNKWAIPWPETNVW